MPNPSENWLLRAKADLTPAIIAKAVAKRLTKVGLAPAGSDIAARMAQRLSVIEKIVARFPVKRVIAVADRGLLSTDIGRTAGDQATRRWPAGVHPGRARTPLRRLR